MGNFLQTRLIGILSTCEDLCYCHYHHANSTIRGALQKFCNSISQTNFYGSIFSALKNCIDLSCRCKSEFSSLGGSFSMAI